MTVEIAISEDKLLGGKLTLFQPERGHRAGTDAMLLIAAARPFAKGNIVDIGAGYRRCGPRPRCAGAGDHASAAC